MHIAFHIGAHCTDDDRLVKSMLRDVDPLLQQGVKIPGAGRYRKHLTELLANIKNMAPTENQRQQILHAITDGEAVDRVVLSNPAFACVLPYIFGKQLFYQRIEDKIKGMRNLFPDAQISYFMGIRNLATFIPMAFSRQEQMDYDEFIRNIDPENYRWSHVAERIKRCDPSANLVMWCHEDSPFIWGQLVRIVSGQTRQKRIAGGYDMMHAVVTDEGMAQFMQHLQDTPPNTEREKREIIGQFMRSHPRPKVVADMEIDLPGWDQARVDRLTAQYYQDVNYIDDMDGVTLVTP